MVCDLLDEARIGTVVGECQPDVVIHTQALSDVDQCEREPDLAEAMNVRTTDHLVRALERAQPLFIYVSTDYVFDGKKGRPYDEHDAPRPISVYGRSKRDGERLALRFPRGVVVRPSTLFGPGRITFCDTVARGLQAGLTVEAFADQTTSPTYTEDAAEMVEALIGSLRASRERWASRVYHVTNAGSCTRVELACRVAALLGRPRDRIRPILMREQHRPARRPAYSALTTVALPNMTGRTLRPWHEALQAHLGDRRDAQEGVRG